MKKVILLLFPMLFIMSCSLDLDMFEQNEISPYQSKAAELVIVIDGNASDWEGIDPISSAGQQSARVLKATHDADYLYFCIQGKKLGPNYDLFIDADTDPSTGHDSWTWDGDGCDYLIENGILYQHIGSGWSWQYIGPSAVTQAANNRVIEIRVKRTAFSLQDQVGIGFWDLDNNWGLKSTLPKNGALPGYVLSEQSPPQGEDMRVLVPAYFYPGAYWDRLASQAFSMPEKIIAIANASNGPGAAVDPNYINAIGNLRVNGGKVIGYVFTNYGKRPQNKVRKDIDLWFSFYTIDGIFLDQQAYTPGKEEYYQELYNYIKTINPQAFIMGNPGTDTIESYLFYNDNRVTDVLCFFETNTGFLNWEPPSWIYKYKNTNFCVLPYNTSASEYEAITDYADVKNAGWVYCTDDVLPNPWDTLPDYFESFSDYVNTKTK